MRKEYNETKIAYAYGWLGSWLQQYAAGVGIPERELSERVGELLFTNGQGHRHRVPAVPQAAPQGDVELPTVEVSGHARGRPRLSSKNSKCPLCGETFNNRVLFNHLRGKRHNQSPEQAQRLTRQAIDDGRKGRFASENYAACPVCHARFMKQGMFLHLARGHKMTNKKAARLATKARING